jgi:hypothetical protein
VEDNVPVGQAFGKSVQGLQFALRCAGGRESLPTVRMYGRHGAMLTRHAHARQYRVGRSAFRAGM